jgi:flagellar biosynthesis protein FlhB
MAEDDGGAERSHDPTETRKQEARAEGRILTSKEALTFASFVVGTGLMALAPTVAPGAVQVFALYLRIDRQAALDDLELARLGMAWGHLLEAALAVALPLMVAVIGVQLAIGGINFTARGFAFRPGKLHPGKGLARMVSAQAAMEVGKAVVKVALLGGIGWGVLAEALPAMAQLWAVAPTEVAAVLGRTVLRLMAGLALGLGLIGGLDLVWQIRARNMSMMMTLQEVKQESKEQNGSPEVKGRLRQMQMEASRRGARERRALDDVPQATAIITNPTHFAIALRYAPGDTRAPVILAMGKGAMAHEIMKRGRKAGVNVLCIPMLARALYFTGEIGTEISEQLYAAVAAVLAHVYRVERGEGSALPEVEVPTGLRFTEWGRPEEEGAVE